MDPVTPVYIIKFTCVNLIRFFDLALINKILNFEQYASKNQGEFGYTLTLNSSAFDWFNEKI